MRGTAAFNSDVCDFYPQIIQAGQELDWEWMGHGTSNSFFINNLEEEQERATIRNVLDTIEKSTGKRPKGWLSPSLSETFNRIESLHKTLNMVIQSLLKQLPAVRLGHARSQEEFYVLGDT
ncbi:hypothetical protein PP175_12580 [Aneurinibacillus sp. Ricciae_BoGa-3]|uniref:hypothetical protein n=1 Tax=Aneurinibacillus sp. Ricciae_BoGa-3 TaxID=3022697 RepID=UPI00233FCDC5|nr:hypothetical protein [Aneurinibacillus sp. Ricciae_BoGa-3]WCK56674.1 hypothetical protein PP175_12580 [Aneurinibacillus sp. Ricciae_BoGa-3]